MDDYLQLVIIEFYPCVNVALNRKNMFCVRVSLEAQRSNQQKIQEKNSHFNFSSFSLFY